MNKISLIAIAFLAMCVMCCTQKTSNKTEVLNDSIAVDTMIVDSLSNDTIVNDNLVVESNDSI